jgi:hypothetical protein
MVMDPILIRIQDGPRQSSRIIEVSGGVIAIDMPGHGWKVGTMATSVSGDPSELPLRMVDADGRATTVYLTRPGYDDGGKPDLHIS